MWHQSLVAHFCDSPLMFFHNFKNPNSVPNLINPNGKTLILKLGFMDQSFYSSITEPNMHPTSLTTLTPCIRTHYQSRCRRGTASHRRSRSLSRCRCAPLRHHPYLRTSSCGDRGSVRIELSPGCGKHGLGRDNIGVEVWCDAVVRAIVCAVVGAMVCGWRRGGGLPERPGAALGLKRESEPFMQMQKLVPLVA